MHRTGIPPFVADNFNLTLTLTQRTKCTFNGTGWHFVLTQSVKPFFTVLVDTPIALPIVEASAPVEISIAMPSHFRFAQDVCDLIKAAAAQRGTGIAERDPEYIRAKMKEGKAVIALGPNDEVAGFCYIETWDHGKYAVNSGLIISPDFRRQGLARRIKRRAFELSRELYPKAKLFGITTSLAVMKINSELGYKPVTFSELTDDNEFWQGCQSCPNYDVLQRMKRQMCLCTGMLYNPQENTSSE